MAFVERVTLAYNNVYFVSEGTDLVVIDTGPNYRGAAEIILKALAGRDPALVIATHGHLDHAGLGQWWQERGVPVLVGAEDAAQTLGHTDRDLTDLEHFVERCGAPPDVAKEVNAGLELRRKWTHEMRTAQTWREPGDGRWPTALRYPPFAPSRVIEHTTSLPCRLTALLSPGHTPGNLVVVLDGNGTDEPQLFSGDQLLPEITPTPAIQFHYGKRFSSLPRFLESLGLLSERYPSLSHCYPGHGEPFANVSEVIATNLDQARIRSERLYDDLRAGGPATLYAIAERIYPRALRRRFWQIISTIQGQLDVLAETRLATCDEGIWSA